MRGDIDGLCKPDHVSRPGTLFGWIIVVVVGSEVLRGVGDKSHIIEDAVS